MPAISLRQGQPSGMPSRLKLVRRTSKHVDDGGCGVEGET